MTDHERLPVRDESRYMIDTARSQELHAGLDELFSHVEYSDPVTQTAHLTGPNLEHPSAYVRIRRYAPVAAGDELMMDTDDEWYLELKQKDGVKERIRRPLGEILIGTSYPKSDAFATDFPSFDRVIRHFGLPLLPVFATQSLRTHYHAPGVRMTVDEHLFYYGVRWGGLNARRIGSVPSIKAELKIEDPVQGDEAGQQFHGFCRHLDGKSATDDESAKLMYQKYQEFIAS